MNGKMELKIRKLTTVILLITGILVIFTAMLLYAAPTGKGSGEAIALGLSKEAWTNMHVLTGFIASGCLLVHLYFNRRPLKNTSKTHLQGSFECESH